MNSTQKHFHLLIILLTFCITMLSSCAQLTKMQAARTIGQNNFTVGGTASAYGANSNDDNDLINGAIVFPYLTFDATYGLADKIDLKASLSTGGNFSLSPKFLLTGKTTPFAIAIEPGIEIQAGLNDQIIMRAHGSTIFSYYFNQSNSISLEPKWISQFDDNNTFFAGASAFYSFPLGDNLQMAASASLFNVDNFDSTETGDVIFSVGVGFQFLLD